MKEVDIERIILIIRRNTMGRYSKKFLLQNILKSIGNYWKENNMNKEELKYYKHKIQTYGEQYE